MHENELWLSCKAGELRGLEGLYSQFYNPLANYGGKFTTDDFCIDESIQDLFRRLWQNRHQMAYAASVKELLYGSFRKILLGNLEYNSSRNPHSLSGEHIPFCLDLPDRHPLIAKSRMTDLYGRWETLLQSLSNRQREAMYLKYYEGIPQERVGDIMNMHSGGTHSLLRTALESLHNSFGNFSLLVLFYLLKQS
ncbi:RNA polymerase sigma factor [Chitinophaga sp. Cy-1792]|uniref:RNA polymerase sigma factor n=1 Tax=Chitinophaga sp. Cy-1792 TaxID=2608339 RepID=UPI0014209EFF|nr:sigma-70 family RNA polymerase sigma factor [Chitinophaga sp. Cy-1792]NIG55125.1 sigma-70 family RNA polymerase sigma factor [Chitinophaga sp. Cy-1792]